MMHDEDTDGYVETDDFHVKVSEPRGDWKYHHVEVVAKRCNSYSGGVTVLQGSLNKDQIRQLHGDTEVGMSTSARMYELIKEASQDFPDLAQKFEAVN